MIDFHGFGDGAKDMGLRVERVAGIGQVVGDFAIFGDNNRRREILVQSVSGRAGRPLFGQSHNQVFGISLVQHREALLGLVCVVGTDNN